MGHSCCCGHSSDDDDKKNAEKKIEDLKKDIQALGFKVEETGEGEMKITE